MGTWSAPAGIGAVGPEWVESNPAFAKERDRVEAENAEQQREGEVRALLADRTQQLAVRESVMRGAEALRNKRRVSERLERERLLEQVRVIEDTLEAIDCALRVRGHE